MPTPMPGGSRCSGSTMRPINSTVVFRSGVFAAVDGEELSSVSCFCILFDSVSLGQAGTVTPPSFDHGSTSNRFTSLMGIAKFRFSPPFRYKVVIPITWPAMLNNGPPLLPGEIGAVTCKNLPPSSSADRIPLTIPFETVDSRESGLPIATTSSPTSTSALSRSYHTSPA